jgi:hypothetical protein
VSLLILGFAIYLSISAVAIHKRWHGARILGAIVMLGLAAFLVFSGTSPDGLPEQVGWWIRTPRSGIDLGSMGACGRLVLEG